MATRIGSVEYLVTADGRTFKRQLRQIGREAGAISGAETGRAFDTSFDKSMRGAGDSAFGRFRNKLSGMWQGLSANARQWTLIIGSVLSSMQQLAVLSSAAGAGLLVLGGAATAALVGLGGFIGAFALLAGDAEKVPESIKGAAEAFRELKTPLQEAQNLLAERAFAGTEVAFGKIGDAIRALTPSLGVLGDMVNRVVNQFADWASSAEGVALLSGLIEKSAPIFEKLLGIVGKLGVALLTAFNNPKFQKAIDDMLTGLEGMFDAFDAFVSSDAFGVWIENTTGILGDLGELIGGLSQMINDLVTPEAYERTSAFLNNLTEALPGITELLEFLGELDPFGILAEGLNSLMNGLTPLFDLLEPIGSIVRDLLIGAFEQLHTWLVLLAPVLEFLAIGFQIAAGALKAWLDYLTPFWDTLQTLGAAIATAADTIWTALEPAFNDLWAAIIQLLPTADEFTAWVNNYAIPAIEDFAEWLGSEGARAIQTFARWLRDDAVPAMQKFWDWLANKVWPVVERASEVLGKAIGAFMSFASGVNVALSILTSPIRFAIDLFNQLAAAASIALGKSQAAKNAGGVFPKTASGGVFNGAQTRIIGEAGAEAVVPLNRALGSVDPSVRWLSAIAQGKTPAMASGGVVGGGRNIAIEAGAIVVQEAGSALATGVEILNRISARLA